MPAAKAFCRSSSKAFAVIAMIGMGFGLDIGPVIGGNNDDGHVVANGFPDLPWYVHNNTETFLKFPIHYHFHILL